MSHRPKYRLAKSADTGACGNKAGLPSTVGVSLAQRRAFMTGLEWKQPCCKSKLPEGCTGPKDRLIPSEGPSVSLTSTFDFSARTITVTLSSIAAANLAATDFNVTAPSGAVGAEVAGLVFKAASGNTTQAVFDIKEGATPVAVNPVNQLAPNKKFSISLKNNVKAANGKLFRPTGPVNVRVTAPTTLKILSLDANNDIAIVQFSNYVSNVANGELVTANFSVGVGAVYAAPSAVAFIGDQVGGQTYQLTCTGLATTNVITIKPVNVHQTVGGVTVAEDDAGILGQEYTSTSTTTSANPQTV